ncbi:uncharacterized protein DS421_6g187470 [Arachis hypogaea]|nr:uncharacterized protein DS421_6g187470 [Arachis hypogaea]
MLAWGQARFKFGVVMTSHHIPIFQANFTCFVSIYALSCILSEEKKRKGKAWSKKRSPRKEKCSQGEKKRAACKGRGNIALHKGTLPSRRATQENQTMKATLPCPLQGQSTKCALEPRGREHCPALVEGRIGLSKKEIKGKMSPMHAIRFEQGTMRKPRTKGDCRAKKPRKLIEFVLPPCFEHGTWKRELCPALGAGRAAFGLAQHLAHQEANLAHQILPWQHQSAPRSSPGSTTTFYPALGAGRAVFCNPGAPRSSLAHQSSTLAARGAPTLRSGRTITFCSALGAGRAAFCVPGSTKAAPTRTMPHQLAPPCINFLPCPPQGQGSLLGTCPSTKRIKGELTDLLPHPYLGNSTLLIESDFCSSTAFSSNSSQLLCELGSGKANRDLGSAT